MAPLLRVRYIQPRMVASSPVRADARTCLIDLGALMLQTNNLRISFSFGPLGIERSRQLYATEPRTGRLKTGRSHYYLVRLRLATLEDLKQMTRIERSSFGAQSYRRELIEKLLTDEEFHNVIAEDGYKKVGYATFFEDARRKRARLVTIAVVPEYRNRGLAKAMLAFLEEEMGKECLRISSLEVGISNAPATKLYLSVGYRIEGTIPDYYGKGKDAFYMEKSIEGGI